jgi:hypothetical protein
VTSSKPVKFLRLEERIAELELLAESVVGLARGVADEKPLHAQLATEGEKWYRGARALLVENEFSGLAQFDLCYQSFFEMEGKPQRAIWDIEYFIHQSANISPISVKATLPLFIRTMDKARALLKSCVSELESRAIPMWTQLSFVVAADEFNTAESLLQSSSDETIVRASGTVARVALERHLLTVAQTKGIQLPAKAVASDILNALAKHSVLTPIQKGNLEALFRIGNNCAHPKETVKVEDVRDLIKRGREMTEEIQ